MELEKHQYIDLPTGFSPLQQKREVPMEIQLGRHGLNKVCEALGIESMEVNRVLIDIPVDGAVMVYSSRFIDERKFDDFLKILAGVETKCE